MNIPPPFEYYHLFLKYPFNHIQNVYFFFCSFKLSIQQMVTYSCAYLYNVTVLNLSGLSPKFRKSFLYLIYNNMFYK
jgi:hypothetical protein